MGTNDEANERRYEGYASSLEELLGANASLSRIRDFNGVPTVEIDIGSAEKADMLSTKLAALRDEAGIGKYSLGFGQSADGKLLIKIHGVEAYDEDNGGTGALFDKLKSAQSEMQAAVKEAIGDMAGREEPEPTRSAPPVDPEIERLEAEQRAAAERLEALKEKERAEQRRDAAIVKQNQAAIINSEVAAMDTPDGLRVKAPLRQMNRDTRLSIENEEGDRTHTEVVGSEKELVLKKAGIDDGRERDVYSRTETVPTTLIVDGKEIETMVQRTEYVVSVPADGVRGLVLPKAVITAERVTDKDGDLIGTSIVAMVAGPDGDRITTYVETADGKSANQTIMVGKDSLSVETTKDGKTTAATYDRKALMGSPEAPVEKLSESGPPSPTDEDKQRYAEQMGKLLGMDAKVVGGDIVIDFGSNERARDAVRIGGTGGLADARERAGLTATDVAFRIQDDGTVTIPTDGIKQFEAKNGEGALFEKLETKESRLKMAVNRAMSDDNTARMDPARDGPVDMVMTKAGATAKEPTKDEQFTSIAQGLSPSAIAAIADVQMTWDKAVSALERASGDDLKKLFEQQDNERQTNGGGRGMA